MKSPSRFHTYLHEKLSEHCDLGPGKISPRHARWILTRYRIPERLTWDIIREMMDCGMLKRDGRKAIIVSPVRMRMPIEA